MQDRQDPLDRLMHTANRIADHADYEKANRRALLWIHALTGLTAGLQMYFWGSAASLELQFGIWVRPVLAGFGIGGGLLLAFGLTRRPRSARFEAAGLIAMVLWDSTMCVGFIAARIKQGSYELIPIDQPLAPGYATSYPIAIYLCLTSLILVHLLTLFRLFQLKSSIKRECKR